MGYVTVKEASEDKLHLQREPTSRSWAFLVGLVSLGLGAAYYSGDYVLWKIAYISGSVFVGLTCMEDWEECVLDKSSKKVTIRRQTLVQRLFQATEGQKIVVADIDDIISVSVQQEEVKYSGTGYIVVINFGAGYSLGVTETTNLDGDKSDQEYIAEKIATFLDLNNKETDTVEKSDVTMATPEASAAESSPPTELDSSPTEPVTMETNTSLLAERQFSSSDESDDSSFDKIDRDELVNFDETEIHHHSNEDLDTTPEEATGPVSPQE